jgi:hypothetical protein
MGVVHQLLDEIRRDPRALAELRAELDAEPDRMLTAVEMAPRLHAHPKSIERWCREGRIADARKNGRVWVMPPDATVAPPRSAPLAAHRGRAAVAIPSSDKAGQDVVAKMRARTKTRRQDPRQDAA